MVRNQTTNIDDFDNPIFSSLVKIVSFSDKYRNSTISVSFNDIDSALAVKDELDDAVSSNNQTILFDSLF
jgi:hypothetical protein